MSGDAPRGGEWHWLWEAYVVGLCAAAMIAVILLNDRFPGDVPVAVAALTGIVVCVLALGRRVARLPEGDWRTFLFVGVVVAFWVLAIWASPVAVAAVPAIYRCVLDVAAGHRSRGDDRDQPDPTGVGAARSGHSIAESLSGHCHYARRRGRDTGDRHGDHDVDATTPQAGRSRRRARGQSRRKRSVVA